MYEAPEIYEEPTPGQCYCHLIRHHPHGGPNELCHVCQEELNALIEEEERIAA
jgi:hypothetical protein